MRKYFDECLSRHQRRLMRKKVRSFLNTNASTSDNNIVLQNYTAEEVIVNDNNLGTIELEDKDTMRVAEEVLEDIQEDDNENPHSSNKCDSPGAREFSDDSTSEDDNENPHSSNECNSPGARVFSDDSTSEDASDHNVTPADEEVAGHLTSDLRDWARQNKSVTHKAIDDFLELLLKNFPNCRLPKSV